MSIDENALILNALSVESLCQLIFKYASLTDEEKFISMISPRFVAKAPDSENFALVVSRDQLNSEIFLVEPSSRYLPNDYVSYFTVEHSIETILRFLNQRGFCCKNGNRLFWKVSINDQMLDFWKTQWECLYEHWQTVRVKE